MRPVKAVEMVDKRNTAQPTCTNLALGHPWVLCPLCLPPGVHGKLVTVGVHGKLVTKDAGDARLRSVPIGADV
jgi:hypothetical protein